MSISYDSGTDSSRDDYSIDPSQASLSSLMYKIEWKDELSKARQNFQSKEPFTLEVATENVDDQKPAYHANKGKPAIEVITPILGTTVGLADVDPDDLSRSRVKFKDISITKVRETRLVIYSQELLTVIRQCIKYFPGVSLIGDRVDIYEPYPILIHHLDEMREMQKRLDTHLESSKKEVHKHLNSLLSYLEEYMTPNIIPAIEKLRKPIPTISFDNLWLLFKPGLDVYRFFSFDYLREIPFAAVVLETLIIEPEEDDNKDGKKEQFYLRSWVLESDGQLLSREMGGTVIDRFEGERRVTSLATYPCKYYDSEDGGVRQKKLIERGRKVYDLLRQMPKPMWYDGYPYTQKRQTVR